MARPFQARQGHGQRCRPAQPAALCGYLGPGALSTIYSMNKRINEVTETPKPAFSICVYCGSRPGNQPEFAAIAALVGTWIGTHGGQLVYGGGRNGLMGIMADAALAAGARVVGVIP